MMTRPFVPYLLLALVLALALGGCIRSPQKSYASRGEILTVVADMATEVDKVLYTSDEKNYVVTPRGDGNTLALVRTRVINQKSAQVTLSIDKEAARLSVENDGEIQEIRLLDFREIGVETSEEVPEDYLYKPLHWGKVQIRRGFEINGWMIFEVPKKSEYLGFGWRNVESVNVIYPN